MKRYVKVKGCDGLYSTDKLLSAGWTHSQISQYCTLVRIGEEPWDGEGRPPVGTVCQMAEGDSIWFDVEILCYDREVVLAYSAQAAERYLVQKVASAKFQTVRTPAQIAADKREAGIKALAKEISAVGSWDQMAAHLYDKGVRLPVEP